MTHEHITLLLFQGVRICYSGHPNTLITVLEQHTPPALLLLLEKKHSGHDQDSQKCRGEKLCR